MNVFGVFDTDTDTLLTVSQRVSKGHERTNLLIIVRLVVRAFLEETMRIKHLLIDTEPRSLTDLFIMLEKVLWHGFKCSAQKTMIAFWSPNAELWSFLGKVAASSPDLSACYQSIAHLDHITQPVIRIRALLRLAVMQKKLAECFEAILSSNLLKMIDLSLYIRPSSYNADSEASAETVDMTNLKVLLDQKNYLEERNRYLERKNADLKQEINSFISQHENDPSQSSEDSNAANSTAVTALEAENARLSQFLSENEDSFRILRQQLADTKKVNVDLYEKVRVAEDRCKKFEMELTQQMQQLGQERQLQKRLVEDLQAEKAKREKDAEQRAETVEDLKKDLAGKTEEYMQTVNVLKLKQEEVSRVNDSLKELQRRNAELSERLKQMPVIEQELEHTKLNLKYKSEKLEECEKALEELGGHLSESKLKVIELQEELLPMSEAQWEKDSNVSSCKGCNIQFTVSKRKHHCRNCGSIFCNSCADARVKLPSSAKPVRVCLNCYNLLRSRHNSTFEDVSRAD